MKPLKITNIQRGCVYDGPGIRTTIFLKGCTLDCPWCCNPETKSIKNEQYFINNKKCLKNQGKFSQLCSECIRMGGKKEIIDCPYHIVENTYDIYTTETLRHEILKDKSLFKLSDGGITFSGGEPLLYSVELTPLMRMLYKESISIYVETTLTIPINQILYSIDYINGYIIDVKLQPEMQLMESSSYMQHLNDAIRIIRASGKDMIFRMVFIDSLLSVKEQIVRCLKDLSISRIELLKCHDLGHGKYLKLGMEPSIFKSDIEKMNKFSKFLSEFNINNEILFV